jgi:hypothetical protein
MQGFYIFLIIVAVYFAGIVVSEAAFAVWRDRSEGLSVLWPIVVIAAVVYFPCRWSWVGLHYSLFCLRRRLEKEPPQVLPESQVITGHEFGAWK